MDARRLIMGMAVGLVMAATAHAQTQISLDGRAALIQRDVGDERWAITHDPAARTATGNVFFPGGGEPAFVWCEIVAQDDVDFNLDCFGADACPGAPCTPAQWNPLGPVTVPTSFFSPPGGEPLSAVPCPSGMDRAGTWCIDGNLRAAQTYDGASTTCHDEGRDLCSIEVMMNCDTLDLSKGVGAPVSCGDATDEGAGRVMWTSTTFAAPGANIFQNQTCYGGDNVVVACVTGELHEFFCCQPARQ